MSMLENNQTALREIQFFQALQEALSEEMERDPRVFVMGEDIGVFGGIYGVTRGLLERFGGQRVIDTPISESGLTGTALGAAMTGGRPVLEIMYMDFLTQSLDQLVNHAAKVRYMSGGQVRVPLVIRTQGGVSGLEGAQHSQLLEGWFVHVPGLKVVCPFTAADAKGLLKAAIRDDNPVVFIEHRALYFTKGHVPTGEHLVPLGKANVLRPGRDVTIVTYARMCEVALQAANDLAQTNIDAEIIDLRTLAPLDMATVIESVKKTHRALILEEDVKTGGVGAEIFTQIVENAFDYLDAPLKRIAGRDVPAPAAPNLEPLVIPRKENVVESVRELFG
ncbi:MAG TPA: alpha-ketoacid dehydrogenase subunit beta [Anaerolineae bacterium]|nr:alpha-ketoacid dehydrogenase subunit beta [Anaerolineae bacterium]